MMMMMKRRISDHLPILFVSHESYLNPICEIWILFESWNLNPIWILQFKSYLNPICEIWCNFGLKTYKTEYNFHFHFFLWEHKLWHHQLTADLTTIMLRNICSHSTPHKVQNEWKLETPCDLFSLGWIFWPQVYRWGHRSSSFSAENVWGAAPVQA